MTDPTLFQKLVDIGERDLEIAEQTRFENAEGKQAQRVDTLNAAAERTIKAKFDYARTMGQTAAAIANVGVGLAGQSAARTMKPAIAAIGGLCSLAIGVFEGSRVLSQSSSQLIAADKAMRDGEAAMARQRPPQQRNSGPIDGAPT